MTGYYTWTEHGEISLQEVGQTSMPMDCDDDDDAYDCRRMLFDSINGYNLTIQPYQASNTVEEDVPNPKAKVFYDMLQASAEPLWEGCPNWTTLQAATALLNWKSHLGSKEARTCTQMHYETQSKSIRWWRSHMWVS
nr:hypothetical protein [Tanacetum cinerariifolium]